MVAYNSLTLIGNLTRVPEIRYTPNGTAVSDLSIAINEKIKDKENTTFVDVTVWDKQAENCCEYLSKGRPVMIEGRLKMDTWEDRETGKKRSKIGVVAQSVQFIGGSEKKETNSDNYKQREQEDVKQESLYDDNESNVPF
jgi:single-strand DNA-binding protein